MIGANYFCRNLNFGANHNHQDRNLVIFGNQIHFSSKKMSCSILGFVSRSKEESRVIEVGKSKNKLNLNKIASLNCLKVGKKTEKKKKEVKLEVESVRGRGGVKEEEIWDAEEVAEVGHYPEHLVIMVNGIIGSASDWKYAAEQFVEKLPDKVIVHRSERNSSTLTFDGVDLMGERLAEEVLSVVKRRPGVQKISFVAHSLGGLVARYAIGRLYEPLSDTKSSVLTGNNSSEQQSSISILSQEHLPGGRIAGLEPFNFITFATPHLGSRGNKQLPLLCGLPFLERRASQTAHWIAGRTGKHLFLTDNDDGKPPLLLRMVNDCDDIKFMSALRSFKRRVAYANANFDHMVGWRTSSIRRQNELPKHDLLARHEKYPHIVYVEKETNNGMIGICTEASTHISGQAVDLEEEMIRGLTQVYWERVDVSFRKSRQRYIAHNTILVKSYWMNSDGADVVFHMIDNFLL